MEPLVSFFNWSLKRLLLTECNAFEKAKVKILFIILMFSLLKVIVVLAVSRYHEQPLQLWRALALLFVYITLLKFLLADKRYIKSIAHIMVGMGLVVIWSNMFIYLQTINIVTIQFAFMLILGSFYLLNIRFALLYAFLSVLPVIVSLFYHPAFSHSMALGGLASPGNEIVIILNFISIIISHYLFQQAFMANFLEKEALNEQLQLAVKDANQAAESKSDFLSTMSHELRTPLNSVIGISNLLLREPHTPEQEENLNILKFSAGNLHTLINDILDFNKLGSGKLDLEAIPVDLNELLNNLSAGLRFQAEQKEIDFILDIDKEICDLTVITDPTRITQIIYNLTGNAIKFTNKGKVILKLKAESIKETTVNLKISVADTGIGISPEQQKTIFEPFTQASSSTTRNFGGTGLGLAIVKRLLYLFNSAINVESSQGCGSIFWFELVLNLSSESAENKVTSLKQIEFDLEGLKILVAEDNPINRLLLKKIFSEWNCELVFAENGQEAINKLTFENYDIVLMDLHMPVMDGYQASKAIREMADPLKSGIPIIALTASVSGNLDEKIKKVGMDGFILKPFKLEDLYAILKQIALKE